MCLPFFDPVYLGGSELALSPSPLTEEPELFVRYKRKRKLIWQSRIDLFYYNLFRFACFTESIVYPLFRRPLYRLGKTAAKLVGKKGPVEHKLKTLNNPKGGYSLANAGSYFFLQLFLLLLTPWNLICGFFRLDAETFWALGIIVISFAVFALMGYFDIPIFNRKSVKDFERFDSIPKADKLRSAALTFLMIAGIWTVSIASFVFYVREIF